MATCTIPTVFVPQSFESNIHLNVMDTASNSRHYRQQPPSILLPWSARLFKMSLASRPEWALWQYDQWGFYIPDFLWRFWLEACPPESRSFTPWTGPKPMGLHVYDVYNDVLNTGSDANLPRSSIFHHIEQGVPALLQHPIWQTANDTFSALEKEAETAIRSLLQQINSNGRAHDPRYRPKMALGRHSLHSLRKYLIFLRFRNSTSFAEVLERAGCDADHMGEHECDDRLSGWVHVLESFLRFLSGNVGGRGAIGTDRVFESIHPRLWDIDDAEICIGLASEPDEYVLTASCFGVVEEDGVGNLEKNFHYFFPVTPRFTLYLFLEAPEVPSSPLSSPSVPPFLSVNSSSAEDVDYDVESSLDIYQRNALLLQTLPRYVIFASSRSMIRSLTYYDERRWIPENLDYSKLLRGCRQESVTHTLMVKASVDVVDLTDDVKRVGDSAIAYGAFADVWKGLWTDRQDRDRQKLVALKVLRTVMMKNVQETLLKRLKDEVLAWHRLEHPNIAPLYGVMEMPNTLAMVSPWCENGTIVAYLREKNPNANRLQLLHEISSGVAYLHNRSPAIVHGDLKGGNILIDNSGCAIITDFGLAKVVEDVTDVTHLTSFFAGSTRWMAPELLLALVEEEVNAPPLSPYSDVYAFASVCLEILTGELPYAHRRTDHAVTVDVMRGVKPCRGAQCMVDVAKTGELWGLMDKCWDQFPRTRPSMDAMTDCLDRLKFCC